MRALLNPLTSRQCALVALIGPSAVLGTTAAVRARNTGMIFELLRK